MFTEQSGNLKQAFIQAGISPLAADAVTHALANCAQSLEHRGPFKVQYVPQESRLVDPDLRRQTQQPLGDYIPSDGERRPFVEEELYPPDEEEPPEEEQPPFDPTDIWDALRGLLGRIQDLEDRVAALEDALAALAALLDALLRNLRNTTECPDEIQAPEEEPDGGPLTQVGQLPPDEQ